MRLGITHPEIKAEIRAAILRIPARGTAGPAQAGSAGPVEKRN